MDTLWKYLSLGCLSGYPATSMDTTVVVVCGDNHSGKSTLVKALWPITPPEDKLLECNVDQNLGNILNKGSPMCMIYCAPPGSVLDKSLISNLCSICRESCIFIILACTNIHAGTTSQRLAVYDCFKKILGRITTAIAEEMISEDDSEIGVFYEDIGMAISINSIEFHNELGQRGIEGIEELRKRLPFSVTELLK